MTMTNTVIDLFEFVSYSWENSKELKAISTQKEFSDDLEEVLNVVWRDRKRFIPFLNKYFESQFTKQRFIDFRKNEIVPRNWIGTIQFRSRGKKYVINLLPKIFHLKDHSYTEEERSSIFAHILWWLGVSEMQSYTTQSNTMESLNSDLLEVFAYLFSTFTLDVFTSNAYHYFEESYEEIETVRGRIDFTKYTNNYAKGNRHVVPCIFDSLQYDNQFNRIVKYVATLVKDSTRNQITKNKISEILFILDEVELTAVTASDCDKVTLNPIFIEFITILDYCKLILSSLSVYKWKDDYSVFALLIPSEKLFENLILATLKRSPPLNVKTVGRKRPGRLNLVLQMPDNIERYKMINDIVIEFEDENYLLLDTKYKIIYDFTNFEFEDVSPFYSVSQADIYQMISYAIGSGITDLALIFPNHLEESKPFPKNFYKIRDELSQKDIRIHPFFVDIISDNGLRLNIDGRLGTIFKSANEELLNQLHNAIDKIRKRSQDSASDNQLNLQA